MALVPLLVELSRKYETISQDCSKMTRQQLRFLQGIDMGDHEDGESSEGGLRHSISVSAGGRQFELTETFVPEVDEVIGRNFGDKLARAFRRYGQQGTPVLIRKDGKSCLLYTRAEAQHL